MEEEEEGMNKNNSQAGHVKSTNNRSLPLRRENKCLKKGFKQLVKQSMKPRGKHSNKEA